jgi:hypothetical protein
MRNYRHFAVGMNANGSKIKRIYKPADTSAYANEWHGNTRFENPRYYMVDLENGTTIKDYDLVVDLPDMEVVH